MLVERDAEREAFARYLRHAVHHGLESEGAADLDDAFAGAEHHGVADARGHPFFA